MTNTLFIKNVVLNDWDKFKQGYSYPGLEFTHRKSDNNEDYCSIYGTKAQINKYLQNPASDIISERCRTLHNLPKYRIYNTTKVRIQ